MPEIKCSYQELVPVYKLIEHPKNPHVYSPEQIDRLAKIIDFQGVRHPIIVSNRSGFIVAGHGRLAALKKLNVAEIPVDYQDFENEAQEYAFIVSDNAIGKDEWAALDMSQINSDLSELGSEIDLDNLGIFSFDKIESADAELPDEVASDSLEFTQKTFILHKTQADIIDRAIEKSKDLGPFVDSFNENSNGNAMARICELFLHG